MRLPLFAYALGLGFCLSIGNPLSMPAQSTTNLTVQAQPMQTLQGLGFSITRARAGYIPSNPTDVQTLYNASFDGFNTLVFWSYIENPTERDQLIANAQQSGLQHIIVNTTGEPQTPQEHAQHLFLEIHEYMLAGYPIYGTTIMNKPNTDESGTLRVPPTFLTEAAKLLRTKLDSAGYTDIKIGGPSTVEWEPYLDPTAGGAAHGYSFLPGDNMMYLQAFLDDSAALAVLDAFDFQSYGWSVRDTVRKLAVQHGKEQWVTLAALDGFNNQNGDPMLAPAITANLLANLNHGVSSWNHWVWDQLFNFNTYQPNLRFRYLQTIGQYFEPGAIVRRVVATDGSQPTPSMAWNYYDINDPANNLQPEIVAAAALNPDSSLSIAVVNLSGIHAQHFLSAYYANEARIYTVNLQIEELLGVPSLTAYPLFCGNNGQFIPQAEIEIENGQFDLFLPSRDMIVLRTAPLSGATTRIASATLAEQVRLFPNPVADQVQVQLPAGNWTHVQADCMDMQGGVVVSLPEVNTHSGQNSLRWRLPATLPNGLYFLRMTATKRNGAPHTFTLKMQVRR